jgi:hypothetical protein
MLSGELDRGTEKPVKDSPEEVTAAQAASLTGLSERTIRRRIAAGDIPARHAARNRYAIHVRDLPVRRSPDDLAARIEALEDRVRLLELQMAQLAVGEALAASASRQADAGGEAGEAGEGADAPEAPPGLHVLLCKLAHETQRLAPLLSALSTQPSLRTLPRAEESETGEESGADAGSDAAQLG